MSRAPRYILIAFAVISVIAEGDRPRTNETNSLIQMETITFKTLAMALLATESLGFTTQGTPNTKVGPGVILYTQKTFDALQPKLKLKAFELSLAPHNEDQVEIVKSFGEYVEDKDKNSNTSCDKVKVTFEGFQEWRESKHKNREALDLKKEEFRNEMGYSEHEYPYPTENINWILHITRAADKLFIPKFCRLPGEDAQATAAATTNPLQMLVQGIRIFGFVFLILIRNLLEMSAYETGSNLKAFGDATSKKWIALTENNVADLDQ